MNKTKKNATGILLTFLIIVGLIIAGPVSAVKLTLHTDKANYHKDDQVINFLASIDIQNGELIPIKKLTLRINDNYVVCNFNLDGSSSCPGISITLLNPGLLEQGNLSAKGYGFAGNETPSEQTTNFGFGYGFDEQKQKTAIDGELLYQIQWDISGQPDGKYGAELEAFAHNDGTSFTYLTKNPKQFQINFNKGKS